MKHIEDVLTYKEAKTYIQEVKALLKRTKKMELFIANTTADIEKLKALKAKEGKKQALQSFVGIKYRDFDAAYDDYLAKLETDLDRMNRYYERTMSAFNGITDEIQKDIIRYYYMEGHTIADTADHFLFSESSISRYKKHGLVQMAETMFGVIIELEAVEEDTTK